ncbi:MAG: hypothetical protein JWQ72_361 [Polaromonas sp.]|nr:hypothetical protein [Polaromonas sp.]
MTAFPSNPTIDFKELGARLRAFRLGSNHKADELAQMLGISRAAVYRMEKGEISKIETLGKLAGILESSLPSLMGVGTEYYSSAVAYIERMRQLERGTKRILAHFDPISILLVSDDFVGYLEKMLRESRNGPTEGDIKLLVDLLRDRRKTYSSKPAPIVSLIGLRELERMVHFGFIGRMDLPPDVRRERIQAACVEVERIASIMEKESGEIQVGVVDETMPSSTFQVFEKPAGSYLAISPFKFAEFPNITTGIASVTSAPEAVSLYTNMVSALWRRSYKGRNGAVVLRKMARDAMAQADSGTA